MKKVALLLNILVLTLAVSSFLSAEVVYDSPFIKTPTISQDGTMIAFNFEGDIWVCSSEGGKARRLTVNLANEYRPMFSPDGKYIVYSASYYGHNNLYVMPVEGGEPRRLTYFPYSDAPSGWSADGKYIYFYSMRDVGEGVYRVPFEGGTPAMVANSYMDNVYSISPSHDGKSVVFSYRSDLGERNRHGYKNYATAELYTADATTPATNLKRITDNLFQDFLPQWSGDDKYVFYLSDKNGSYNIFRYAVKGAFKKHKQITKIEGGSGISWFSVDANNKAVAIHNNRLHIIDLENGGMREISIETDVLPKFQEQETADYRTAVTEFEVSPDNKKIAYISHHDVFVTALSGGYSKPLTSTPQREACVSWAPDSTHIIFNRIIDNGMNVVRLNVATGEEEVLTKGTANRFNPRYTPDGKKIFYQRNFDAICSMDPDGSNEQIILKGSFSVRILREYSTFNISKDGKWLYLFSKNENGIRESRIKKIGDDSEPILMNPIGGWSFPEGFTADYKHFVFSSYIGNRYGAYVIDFEENTTVKKGKKQILDELLNPPAKDEKKNETKEKEKAAEKKEEGKDSGKSEKEEKKPEPGDIIDTSDLLNKVRTLSPMLNTTHYVACITKRGTAIVVVDANGSSTVLACPVSTPDGSVVPPRPLFSVNGRIGGLTLDPSERNIVYSAGGNLYVIPIGAQSSKQISPASLRFTRPAKALRKAVLDEAIWAFHWGFYDENLHGVDSEELRARYTSLVESISIPSHMQFLMNDLVGEYNASHMGFTYNYKYVNPTNATDSTPHIGLVLDDSLIEQGQFKIAKLIRRTPAYRANSGIMVGDYIIAVNGRKTGKGINIYELLRNTGEEIEFVLSSSPDGEETRLAYVRPISFMQFYSAFRYDWEESNRKYVEEKTNGRIGYIYLTDMMDENYSKYRFQMERYMGTTDGVILDFRYNYGGKIANQIASTLNERPSLFNRFRGGEWITEGEIRAFSYTKATCGMFNYGSYSNAEMMAANYRLLDLGPSVGLPTAGAVIGVLPVELVDGSSMQLPELTVFDRDGRNLERSPTEPEFMVDETIEDNMSNKLPQLDRAIVEILKDAKKNNNRRNNPKSHR